MIFLLCIGSVSGCSKDTILKFTKKEVESISVNTYDFENKKTTTNWVYKKGEMEDLLYYLESLSGVKTESLNITDIDTLLYGIELNAGNSVHVLFAGDYAITDNGEYYLIDKAETEKVCKSIDDNTRVTNLTYLYNHRYLSLIDGKWNTTYMIKSRWTESQIADIHMSSNKAVVSNKDKSLELEIINNSPSMINFGAQFELEALVDDEWYNIDDMINDNINLGWTQELLILNSSESLKDDFLFLKYYQPLPIGKYRVIKEIAINDKKEYVAYMFEVK